jgi:adenylate cyclase class 2
MVNQELEVKFYVRDLSAIQSRLEQLGARLVQHRVLETNLRFDTPDHKLMQAFQVLRLRKDIEARLTYKGPASAVEGVRIRQEIEFTVSSFEKAQAFVEALGYVVVIVYEKYRAMYDLDEVHVTLDELPYGNFVEIEGPDVKSIQAVNAKLGLRWEANIPASYIVLFEMLKARSKFAFRDLVFENFNGLVIQADDMGVTPAD